MIQDITIDFAGEALTLTTERGIWFKREKAIILSDTHFGKTAHFRKNGLAVPENLAQKDLERLSNLLLQYKAEQLIIAGDFFHASANSEIQLLKEWQNEFSNLNIVLVKGNHDSLKNSIYQFLNIETVKNNLQIGNITISHFPNEEEDKPTICGHIHPGVLLKLKGRQKIKLPSYLVQKNQIILPAFSLFTGLDTSLQNTGINYAFTIDSIFCI